MTYAIAMLSVHTSPLEMPGRTKDAGGMNVYISQLAQELGRADSIVDIFTRRTGESQPTIVQISPNVRVIHIQAGPATPLDKDDLSIYIPAFAQQIDEFRRRTGASYDLLHSHYWLSGMAGMQLAGRWRIPHITMFHTLAHLKQLANPGAAENPVRLEMERRLIASADRIIVATPDERNQMLRHCGAMPRLVEVIPCGVDLARFVPHDRQSARATLGWKAEQPVLLYVGRLDPFKGPDLLLRAAALMQEKAEVVIVGGKTTGDADAQQLRALAAELRISRRAHFPGARPQQELPLIYSAADVMVVPSYHESFGMAAVEALACATPVVATRAGGLTSVIKNGETGYLVPRCPGFFAAKLDMLLQQPALLEKMREAARPSVLQYSWKNVASSVRNLYEDVLDEADCLAAL